MSWQWVALILGLGFLVEAGHAVANLCNTFANRKPADPKEHA